MKKRIIVAAIAGIIIAAPVVVAKEKSNPKEIVYIVQYGDTVYSIAEKYKDQYEKTENKIATIQVDNNIGEIIYPGQKIVITKEE